MNSLEINGSFYSLQRPSSYQTWYDATPPDFVFAVKGGRYITHMRRLNDIKTPLANFLASGILCLKEKLGPILWQFPPHLQFNPDKFDAFFDLLPRDTQAAARLARQHDDWIKDRAWTRTEAKRALRHCVEVRNPSFHTPQFIKLLRWHKIALVVADTAGRWPYMEDVTADFIYIRLHGFKEMYVQGYDDAALDWWADRIRAWRSGKEAPDRNVAYTAKAPARKSRDIYVYFDNDVKVRAPVDAINLMARFGGQRTDIAENEPPRFAPASRLPTSRRISK